MLGDDVAQAELELLLVLAVVFAQEVLELADLFEQVYAQGVVL